MDSNICRQTNNKKEMEELKLKKIDLHVHTIKTISDSAFDFSMENLKHYIEVCNLDSIAITNHNLFDKNQFLDIKSNLNIKVFPGIEVNLEKGHVLIISEDNNVDDFETKCKEVENRIITAEDFLNYEDFLSIFGDLNEYLIIPHYYKDPSMPLEILNKLNPYIQAVEVGSSKKWSSFMKESESKTPVIFSDFRAKDGLLDKEIPVKQTYIDIDDITISKLKMILSDKGKVHISSNNDVDSFQILHDGTNASNKLNVILGKRSSGKTYTLDTIYNSYKNQKIKYIKQFELVENSGKEKFEELINKQQQESVNEFYKELKDVVKIMVQVSEYNISDIDEFLTTLKEYAVNKEKDDIFSKCKLFGESKFYLKNNDNLKRSINAVITLLEDKEIESIVTKHIKLDNMKLLLIDLIKLYREKEYENTIKDYTNKLVDKIKEELGKKSSLNPIKDLDFIEIAKNELKIRKFNELIGMINEEKTFKNEKIEEFKIIGTVSPIKQVSDITKQLKYRISLSEAFKKYKNPFNYLIKLKDSGVNIEDLYKCLWKVDFKVVNKFGNELSGGEKAEYNLLAEIKNSYKNDILLIDEPESSFDNIFIKQHVIDMIKDISNKTTVFLVTHNNTLGLLMSPDCIIYTEHNLENGQNNFLVYTGKMSSNELKTANGERIRSYDILMDTMEAGIDAYERRKELYENIKN